MSKLLFVKRLWNRAPHNALTDLIYYKEAFFCCFREADKHAGGRDGSIRILRSTDAKTWSSVAVIAKKGIDLRDPMLSEMPDGRLLLSMGGSLYQKEEYLGCTPHAAFSNDGTLWGSALDLQMPNEWIWRVTWHKGVGYGASYRLTDPSDIKQPWILTLFKTTDGKKYECVTELKVANHPSETTLRFTDEGVMVAMVRRWGRGWIGRAKPPYIRWKWFETRYRFGGPNFLILPNGEMWACSRGYRKGKPYTILAQMGLEYYKPVLLLPSGGDTSYPGMVLRDDTLYISYYSSHEKKTMVYLAAVQPI